MTYSMTYCNPGGWGEVKNDVILTVCTVVSCFLQMHTISDTTFKRVLPYIHEYGHCTFSYGILMMLIINYIM